VSYRTFRSFKTGFGVVTAALQSPDTPTRALASAGNDQCPVNKVARTPAKTAPDGSGTTPPEEGAGGRWGLSRSDAVAIPGPRQTHRNWPEIAALVATPVAISEEFGQTTGHRGR